MATDAQSEFDLATLLAIPMQLFGHASGALDNVRRAMDSFVQTVESLQRSAEGLESLIHRVDDLVALVEGPARLLVPEIERATLGLRVLTDTVDLLPLDQLPDVVNRLNDQVSSFAGLFGLKLPAVPRVPAKKK